MIGKALRVQHVDVAVDLAFAAEVHGRGVSTGAGLPPEGSRQAAAGTKASATPFMQ